MLSVILVFPNMWRGFSLAHWVAFIFNWHIITTILRTGKLEGCNRGSDRSRILLCNLNFFPKAHHTSPGFWRGPVKSHSRTEQEVYPKEGEEAAGEQGSWGCCASHTLLSSRPGVAADFKGEEKKKPFSLKLRGNFNSNKGSGGSSLPRINCVRNQLQTEKEPL